MNGSGNNNNLKEMKAELKAAGYTVSKEGKTTTTSNTVVIERKAIEDSVKKDILQITDLNETLEGEESGDITITIIIGTDYIS